MGYISIDLGSTNLKVALYDRNFNCIEQLSTPMNYQKKDSFVEFDVDEYFDEIKKLIGNLKQREIAEYIILTGQAESLVIINRDNNPICNAISWMDSRSEEECNLLMNKFSIEEVERVTGQRTIAPTWPATKILWLKKNNPSVYKKAAKYVLLKDYIVYRLSGNLIADKSIATFSLYFDIYKGEYWSEMLDFMGISQNQLPPLTDAFSNAGSIIQELASELNLSSNLQVNIGTLDHFAGMLGTGNNKPGKISLSTGTVMALATISTINHPFGVPMHYGLTDEDFVLLPVIESGGISLDWFLKSIINQGYSNLEGSLMEKNLNENIIFLPYIIGENAPYYDKDMSGIFFGLKNTHDRYDMTLSIMKGVAFALKENCEYLADKEIPVNEIIATGGGTKSELWCQLYADITGVPVVLPENQEAALLGCIVGTSVKNGMFSSFDDAFSNIIRIKKIFAPNKNPVFNKQYGIYKALYNAARGIEIGENKEVK